jgi:hypothetical protein
MMRNNAAPATCVLKYSYKSKSGIEGERGLQRAGLGFFALPPGPVENEHDTMSSTNHPHPPIQAIDLLS